MSELVLKVAADLNGLNQLKAAIQAAKAELASTSSSAASSGASGASAELARVRSEVTSLTAALRTQQSAYDELSKRVEDLSKRRSSAVKQAADDEKKASSEVVQAKRAEQAEAQMLLNQSIADNTRWLREKQRGVAETVKAGQAERASLEQTMGVLRQKRAMEEQSTAATMRSRAAQAESSLTLQLLNRDISTNVKGLRDQATEANRVAAQKRTLATSSKAAAEAQRDMHSAVRGLAGGLGMLWLSYGSVLPMVAGFAAAGSALMAIKSGQEFGYQLAFVGAISGETGEKLRFAGQEFMRFAESSQFSATEVAKGARVMAQAGFSLDDSLKTLPQLLKFSTLGEIELAQGAEIAAGMMHAFNLSVADVPRILDSTAKAAQISQTTIAEMGQALRQASTIGSQYNVSLDETNALLAVLAQRNIRGSAAGTALRNMFVELDPVTEKAKRAYAALGVQVTDTSGRYKDIIQLLGEFSVKFNQYNDVSQNRISRDYFNERGAKAFLNAIKEANGDLPKFLKAVQQSGGELDKQFSQIEGTLKVQLKEAMSAFENSAISAFQSSEGSLVDLTKSLKAFAQSEELRAGITSIIQLFGMLASVIVSVVQAAGALAKTKFVKEPLRILNQSGSDMGQAFYMLGQWAGINDADPDLSPVDPNSAAYRQARSIRLMNQQLARDSAIQRAEAAAQSRSFRASEIAYINENGRNGWGKPDSTKLNYDPAADKSAARLANSEVEAEMARYRRQESMLQGATRNQLEILKAYHSSRLLTDAQFAEKEAAITDAATEAERARLQNHVDHLLKLREKYNKSNDAEGTKRREIDTKIEDARAKLDTMQEQRDIRALARIAKIGEAHIDAAQKDLDSIKQKNEALRLEVEALRNYDTSQKDSTLVETEAKLTKHELTLAQMELNVARFDGLESLTQEQELQAAQVRAERDRIEQIKKEIAERRRLLTEKKQMENDWTTGAVAALKRYQDGAGSTAKAMEEMFTKAFQGMEDALVSFVMTGKMDFKGLINSILSDLARLAVKEAITKPLSEMLMGLLKGGSGGSSIGSLFSSLFGSGGGSGSFDSAGWAGTGINGATGASGGFMNSIGSFLSAGAANPAALAAFMMAAGSAGGSALARGLGAGQRGQRIASTVGMFTGILPGAIAGYFSDPDGLAQRSAMVGRSGSGNYNYGATSAFGSFGVFNDKWFSDSEMGGPIKEFLKNMADFENAISKYLSATEIKSVSSALDSAKQYGFGEEHSDISGALGGILLDRVKTIVGSLDKELTKFLDNFEGSGADLQQAVMDLLEVRKLLQTTNIQGLTLDAVKALQVEGETAAGTLNRVVTGISGLIQMFSTESQSLAEAEKQVKDAFGAAGVAAPRTAAEALAMVKALDLSTEAGRTLYNTFMGVSSALQATTTAGARFMDRFNAVMGTLKGQSYTDDLTRARLNANVDKWINIAGWGGTISRDQVISGLGNVSRDDFAAIANQYGLSAQELALQILEDYAQLNRATSDVAQGFDSASSVISNFVDNTTSINNEIEKWAKGKLLSSDSPLKPGERLDFALAEYERVVRRGDKQNFTGAGDALIEAGRGMYGSGEGYTQLFNRVMADAQTLGGFTLDYASNVTAASIDAMRAELAAQLRDQTAEVVELRTSVDALNRRLEQMTAEQAATIQEAADSIARSVTGAITSLERG